MNKNLGLTAKYPHSFDPLLTVSANWRMKINSRPARICETFTVIVTTQTRAIKNRQYGKTILCSLFEPFKT